ncbi:sensor histidine kinase [Pseudonocardia kunmingensis]|uniref:histidine kinase n=1 Tax=Pseudonocardia kunmingensis TaxID=630975 RepID=A0A543DRL5_9PSEU|nr:sensor histidine kinase [Pseudonocardia kunmingensis]TQM11977.1 signal transduction histidine kinase [Pseudonocardia kunmingensis]
MDDQPPARPLPAWAVDAALGVGVAVVVSVVISAGQGGRQQPDAAAYLWAVGLGALMLARRRYPRAVLAVSVLGLFAYYAAGYPAVGLAVPVAAALFSAAEAGRLATAIGASLLALGTSLWFRLLEGQDVAFVLGYDLVPHVTLMAAAIALGDTLRSRRAQHAQQRELTRLQERQYAQDAERRVHAERLAIARDLHDSLGHAVSVISLHADVAREAVGRDEGAVREALALIRDAAGRTMRELRATVAVLRAPGETTDRLVSLAGVEPVLRTAHDAGIRVTDEIAVAPGALPATVDAAAYRIVQEAVTNAVRHSGASHVHVAARTDGTALALSVTDDGGAVVSPGTGGHGIAGMTERARALGGQLTAGTRETGGFTVQARLPLEPPP